MPDIEEHRNGEQRITGNSESGSDAMAGRRHCGDSEGAVDYTPQCESQPPFGMGNNSIQSGATIYTSQGESQPHFVMGSNSIQDHRHGVYISQSQSRPQVLTGGTSGPPLTYGTYDGNNTPQSMPSVYPTHKSFQELFRSTSVQHFAVQVSQASHSPANSHVDGHP
ncbi:hypothetical protein CsSME_00048361 [Camellia sinensis var. sinensis]